MTLNPNHHIIYHHAPGHTVTTFTKTFITGSLSLWSYVCLYLPLLVKAIRYMKSGTRPFLFVYSPSADHRVLDLCNEHEGIRQLGLPYPIAIDWVA